MSTHSARSHGQALSGQHDSRWTSPQDVIQVPRTDDRDQGPCTLTARTQDSPGGGLHSQCSKFGRCDIASEGSRHVVLAAVHTTRVLALGRGDLGLGGVYGPVCLQTEHSCPKIRNASSLSSQCSIQRLTPRLVAGVHGVDQPVFASLDSSFGKSSSVKRKRYSHQPPYWTLQPWFQGVQRLSTAHYILPPPPLCVRPHHPNTHRASSSLSSIERCNCRQWSSTVREG
jgi:hypothetical protein